MGVGGRARRRRVQDAPTTCVNEACDNDLSEDEGDVDGDVASFMQLGNAFKTCERWL